MNDEELEERLLQERRQVYDELAFFATRFPGEVQKNIEYYLLRTMALESSLIGRTSEDKAQARRRLLESLPIVHPE